VTPLTPDFIDHPWAPLERVQLTDNFVDLSWPDGLSFRAYSLWLRENAELIGIESTVREGMIDPSDLPGPDALLDAELADDGALLLSWKEDVPTRIHPGWLRYVAEGRLNASEALPQKLPWSSQTVTEPPSLDGSSILNDEGVQLEWLHNLVRYGLCRLQNTDADESFLESLMNTIGPIRASNFGRLFSVKSIPNPDSTANTGLNLGQHTDLPTRETPPGYQMLHCLENTTEGGNSRMTDGLAVVHTLRDEQPEAFELLANEKWIFMNRTPDAEHRWEGSIIELPVDGRPLTIRAFYPVRSAPLMEEEKIPAAYEAMRTFSEYAHDPRFQISYPFSQGDLVGFDNRRVMHGRDAFASTGTRHLHGCYIDHDEIYSRLRVLNRPTSMVARHGN
jgi:gamma-butyrobetaine dioxygenase